MLETTLAGSLPKPSWLAEPEKLWPAWRLAGTALEAAKCDAALVCLKEQEDAGIDIVSNGEQFRVHFVHGFLETIEGIDWKTRMGIRADRYVVEVPTVTGPVRRRASVHGEEVRFTRARTKRQLKFTLPGPMTICDTIANAYYPRRADMAMAFARLLNEEARELAALGVDVLQFDEPAFNVFMDAGHRRHRAVSVRRPGGDRAAARLLRFPHSGRRCEAMDAGASRPGNGSSRDLRTSSRRSKDWRSIASARFSNPSEPISIACAAFSCPSPAATRRP
jgi:methionine synthase II (cobalamin-independent)